VSSAVVSVGSFLIALLLSWMAGPARPTWGARAPGRATGDCEKVRLGVFGDPAICLPAQKPAQPGEKACKEYSLVCCCEEDHLVDPGQVTRAEWKTSSFVIIEGVPGKTVVTPGKKLGEFTSILQGGATDHQVRVGLNLNEYDRLVAAIGADCYAFFDVSVEGICVVKGKERTVKAQFDLAVAKPLKAVVCLRNLKKAGSQAGDPANSTRDLGNAAFVQSVNTALNKVYGAVCLEIEVKVLPDLNLPANQFGDDGSVLSNGPGASNTGLNEANDPDCIDVFVAAFPEEALSACGKVLDDPALSYARKAAALDGLGVLARRAEPEVERRLRAIAEGTYEIRLKARAAALLGRYYDGESARAALLAQALAGSDAARLGLSYFRGTDATAIGAPPGSLPRSRLELLNDAGYRAELGRVLSGTHALAAGKHRAENIAWAAECAARLACTELADAIRTALPGLGIRTPHRPDEDKFWDLQARQAHVGAAVRALGRLGPLTSSERRFLDLYGWSADRDGARRAILSRKDQRPFDQIASWLER
jgi:hypothetical protein